MHGKKQPWSVNSGTASNRLCAHAHALGSAQERILLRDDLAADFREVDRDDLARIRRAEVDAFLARSAVAKYRHEQRLARDQSLPGTNQRAQEPAFLLRTVAKDGLHLDPVL